jgi:hypothetical protein
MTDAPPPALSPRLVVAGSLFGGAALLFALRLVVVAVASSAFVFVTVLPVLLFAAALVVSVALWSVSGSGTQPGVAGASRPGRLGLRIAAVALVVVPALTAVLPPRSLLGWQIAVLFSAVEFVGLVALGLAAVVVVRVGVVPPLAGWALLVWAALAVVRQLFFTSPVWLGEASVAIAWGGQVVAVLSAAFVAVAWLVVGLGAGRRGGAPR